MFVLNARANDSLVEPTASVNLITQNVYGFADFTTTIGNTVMIFSPSSVAVAIPGEEIVYFLNNDHDLCAAHYVVLIDDNSDFGNES